MKRKSIKAIASVLGATTVAAGMGIAAVAQACRTTGGSTPDESTSVAVVTRALENINQRTIYPPQSTNASFLYFELLAAVNAIDEANNITELTAITIINFADTVSVTEEEDNTVTVRIATNGLRIEDINAMGGALFYGNQNEEFIISGIELENEIITNIEEINGIIQENAEAIIVRNSFTNLNQIGTNIPDQATDPNAHLMYQAILSYIQTIDTGITAITNIIIDSEETNLTVDVSGTSMSLLGNALTVTAMNATEEVVLRNNDQLFTVMNITGENGLITSAGVLSGLEESLTVQESTEQLFAYLTNRNSPPEAGTNAARFLNILLPTIINQTPIVSDNPTTFVLTGTRVVGDLTIAANARTLMPNANGAFVLVGTLNISGVVTPVEVRTIDSTGQNGFDFTYNNGIVVDSRLSNLSFRTFVNP